MKIYIITENYVDGGKYICSTKHRGTGEYMQVHRHIEDAERALQECRAGLLPRDTFTYEMNELEI